MAIIFVKSAFSILVIYALYISLLTRENAHEFKRLYLIGGLLFSSIVPFVNLSIGTPVSHIIKGASAQSPSENIWFIYTLYLSISFIITIRFILNLLRLVKLKKQNQTIKHGNYNIVLINNKILPFSFFNYIYVHNQDYASGKISEELLLHEFAHVKQKHSIDIVFIELFQIIFWLNPVVYLIKKEIKINHEYLADKGVVNSGIARQRFQQFILSTVSANTELSLTSCFSSKLTKKRLLMLNVSASPVRMYLKLAILIPVIIFSGISIMHSQHSVTADYTKTQRRTANYNVMPLESSSMLNLDFLHQYTGKEQNNCDDYCHD